MTAAATWGYDVGMHRWALATWAPAVRGELPQLDSDPLASYDGAALVAVPPKARKTVAARIFEDSGQQPPAHVFDGVPDEWLTMTCPRCWHVSFNRDDAGARYCPVCEWWTGDPRRGPHPSDQAPAAGDQAATA